MEQRGKRGGSGAGQSEYQSHIRAQFHGQNSQQHLAEVPMRHREAEELRRPNSGKIGARRLHIRAQLHGQKPKQHLADVPSGVGKATNWTAEQHENGASQRKGVAHPSAVARTRTKTATGGCTREASGRQRTRSAEQHQNAASQRKALHIRAQLHGQEPKQQLADVPRGVGKATNSVSRTASERGKSAQGVAHPSAVARTRTKTATGGCTREASGSGNSGTKRLSSAARHARRGGSMSQK